MTTKLHLSAENLVLDPTAPELSDVCCALGPLLADAGAGRPMMGGTMGMPFYHTLRRNCGLVTFFFDLLEAPDRSVRRLKLLAITVDKKKFA